MLIGKDNTLEDYVVEADVFTGHRRLGLVLKDFLLQIVGSDVTWDESCLCEAPPSDG
jgi:hypothetical protein